MTPSDVLTVGKTFGSVALRRARKGPRRADWPLLFEALVEVLRELRKRTQGLPINDQRREWDAAAPPSTVAHRMTITHAEGAPVPSFWCAPRELSEGTAPVVLFIHGGAFSWGSFRTHGELASRIALSSGARVFFPEYRLAPEHPFPAGIDDVMASYEHLLRTVDASRIVVAGDSAGGNFTACLMLRARDRGLPLPAGGVMICPYVDLTEMSTDTDPDDWITGPWGESYKLGYLDGHAPNDPQVSPHHADLRGLPPLLVQAGGAEILEAQVSRFVERARAASVDVLYEVASGMIHDWHMFAALYPPAHRSIESIARFVRSRTRKS